VSHLKFPFSILERTCFACPSQWEGFTSDGRGVYIRYRHDKLSVYISRTSVPSIDDCIDEDNLVLLMEDLLGQWECGFLEDDALFQILKQYDYLED
jgi:hypothetical protein